MNKTIRLAVVGTGGMANAHAERFLAIPGVEICAVCDVDADRARAYAKKHASGAVVFSDLGKMLAETRPDGLSNVTPDRFHAPLSIQALEAGVAVFCEKPLAISAVDARRMAALAAQTGLPNMVNFSYRNAPAIQEAARMVRDGLLGRIVHVEASYLQSWLACDIWGDWRTTPAWLWRLSSSHGSLGVLGDIGVHILDFATFPVGPLARVNARLKTFREIKGTKVGGYTLDANDSAVMHVEFANGALGVIHTSRWASGHANSLALRLHGTLGALRIDLDRSLTDLEACTGEDLRKPLWKTITAPPTPSTYERFIAALRSGVNDQPDFARGAEIQAALEACVASDASGKTVSLSA